MDKEKLDLCDSLIKLGKAAVKQKEVVAKYGELGSEEEYVNKKVGASADEYVNRVLPMPKEKTTTAVEKKPSKKSLICSICIVAIIAIIAVALVFNVIQTYSMRSNIEDIQADRGTAYHAWINSFSNFSSFDQLEDGWKAVEEDWKNRGIDVDWDFVVAVKNNAYPYGGTIYADEIDSALMTAIEDLDNNVLGSMQIPVLVVVCVLVIVFALNIKKKHKIWKLQQEKYAADQRRIAENIEYNNNLPKLIAEREVAIPAIREQYSEKVNEARAEHGKLLQPILDEYSPIEKVISQYGHLLPKRYHEHAELIGLMIRTGEVDSIEEAIHDLACKYPNLFGAY